MELLMSVVYGSHPSEKKVGLKLRVLAKAQGWGWGVVRAWTARRGKTWHDAVFHRQKLWGESMVGPAEEMEGSQHWWLMGRGQVEQLQERRNCQHS